MSSNAKLCLDGDMTRREVPAIWRQYRDQARDKSLPATIDLAGVGQTDSSGLALLLEWQGLSGSKISFINPPDSMKVIARLTETVSLLGWNNEFTESDAA